MMTGCQFRIKKGQKIVKIGIVTNSRMGETNLTLIFKIDKFLINYS